MSFFNESRFTVIVYGNFCIMERLMTTVHVTTTIQETAAGVSQDCGQAGGY